MQAGSTRNNQQNETICQEEAKILLYTGITQKTAVAMKRR
jgi:hypothetical protein